jgi:hypothetical protein
MLFPCTHSTNNQGSCSSIHSPKHVGPTAFISCLVAFFVVLVKLLWFLPLGSNTGGIEVTLLSVIGLDAQKERTELISIIGMSSCSSLLVTSRFASLTVVSENRNMRKERVILFMWTRYVAFNKIRCFFSKVDARDFITNHDLVSCCNS